MTGHIATTVSMMAVRASIQQCGRRPDESEVKRIEAHINTLFIVHFFRDHQFLEVLARQRQQPSTLPRIRHWTAQTPQFTHKCSELQI